MNKDRLITLNEIQDEYKIDKIIFRQYLDRNKIFPVTQVKRKSRPQNAYLFKDVEKYIYMKLEYIKMNKERETEYRKEQKKEQKKRLDKIRNDIANYFKKGKNE